MRSVGLVSNQTELTDLVNGLKKILKTEYDIAVFSSDEHELTAEVEKAVDGAEIPIFVIDAQKDENSDIAYGVLHMFEIMHNPIFMIVNYEDLDDECLSDAENIVGDILLDMGIVSDPRDVKFEVVFFSPRGDGQAFRSAEESTAKDADALTNLLDFYDDEE